MRFSEFDQDKYPVLGEGVWGRVFDLGDGAVIKIAKGKGGIGDGVEKLLKEQHLLEVFESSGANRLPFQLPRCIAAGEVTVSHHLFNEGFRRWMVSTKVPGKPIEVREPLTLPAADVRRMASSLAEALCVFHHFLNQTPLASTLKTDPIFEAIRNDGLPLTKEEKSLCALVESLYGAQDNTSIIHGDFNISNIMMDDDCNVTGILDFAEACLGNREDDLASLIDELPSIKNELLTCYKNKSGTEADPYSLALAETKRAMISMIICRYRLGDSEAADQNEKFLKSHLEVLKPKIKNLDVRISP